MIGALLVCALIYVGACESASAQAPTITKVEPPSWWAAHTINPVRLLVRGANFRGARVIPTRREIQVSDLRVNDAATYLFLSVRISPFARPGDYPLLIETTSGRATIPFKIEPQLDPSTNFQGINADDIIYLIMPDRFSNGDASNDAPLGSPREANDRENARAYHGGDIRGVINHLSYLRDLGVTAIWLTPWYDNWNGVNTCAHPWCPNTFYHGYAAIDYYGVEDHFGTLEDVRELVRRAHQLGLKVIQDQVANHVGSRHPWMDDPPLPDWFHGTRASHTQNPFRGDMLLSPHASEADRRPTLDGWFADEMPDMNQEEAEVARYEIQNALWWVGTTGIDGIRQDTIQYMPRFFIRELSRALHRQFQRMWMVGEANDPDAAHVAFFMGGREGWDGVDTELDSDFDFPLWHVSEDVFTNKKPVRALRDELKYDALYVDATRLTTLVGNHDFRRFISLNGGTLRGAMLHLAFTLTVRGTPQLYYGDEIAMPGADDPDNRQDFPGGFPGDTHNAFLSSGRTGLEQRMYAWTRQWIQLRRDHTVIRKGRLIDIAFDDDAYIYARADDTETIIIAINRSLKPKKMTAPASVLNLPEGARLMSLPLTGRSILLVSNHQMQFQLPARSAEAFTISR
ncbi:MAG TPA: alpha-amylase family glycosyl hydrolase [Pyrinomonadaceae bacterium]|nr:alpha-amylase family glycosyl hydrolase [Pyrinomonadaceae bacterium]